MQLLTRRETETPAISDRSKATTNQAHLLAHGERKTPPITCHHDTMCIMQLVFLSNVHNATINYIEILYISCHYNVSLKVQRSLI